MIARLVQRLRRDERGVSIVEFAIIAPAFLVMMMAVFDLSYRTFIHSTLQGAVHKAARDGTLESGASASTSLNARVRNLVTPIVANGTWTFDRKNYASFTRAGAQEVFTDSNGNNIRDAGECFQDENGNSVWDADSGAAGQGGAKDISKLTVTVVYPKVFPLYGLLGWSQNQTISATTVIRNQPYDSQNARPITVVCT